MPAALPWTRRAPGRSSRQARRPRAAASPWALLPTLAPLLLPGCIARARLQCPSVTLRVSEGFSPQLLDALLTGRLDLAVTTNPPRSLALSLTPLISEPLVLVTRPGPRGTRSSFSLAELAKTPLILSLGIRALLEQQLAGRAALRVEAEVDSIEAIRRLLLAGVGASVMPVSAFHAEVSARRLAAYPVEGANLHRILVLARPIAEARSAAIDEIERIVRTEMSELAQAGLFRLPGSKRGSR